MHLTEREIRTNLQSNERWFNAVSTDYVVRVVFTRKRKNYTEGDVADLRRAYKSARRKRKEAQRIVERIMADGYGVTEISRILGVSRVTVWRVLK